jgi:hypothetical protein
LIQGERKYIPPLGGQGDKITFEKGMTGLEVKPSNRMQTWYVKDLGSIPSTPASTPSHTPMVLVIGFIVANDSWTPTFSYSNLDWTDSALGTNLVCLSQYNEPYEAEMNLPSGNHPRGISFFPRLPAGLVYLSELIQV